MLKKILLRSGINKESTRYAAETLGTGGNIVIGGAATGWYDCDKVRFRSGNAEKIGGWTRISVNTFLGVCRSLWNWVTLTGNNLMGVGTDQKFYIENGGAYFDVTPFRIMWTLTDPFTTVSGSSTVTVLDLNAGFADGDFVIFYNSSAVGGLTLLGQYQISYASGSTYTIQAAAAASSAATGGGTVYAVYQVNTGSSTVAALVGWGSGGWGIAAWSEDGATSTTAPLSALGIWNQHNFGQDLLFGQRGGPLYYWSANIGTTASTVSLTIASPGVASGSKIKHLVEGQSIILSTTVKLPTGLLPGVTYYVKNLNIIASTCNLSATAGGVAINTSGTQSGIQSILPNAVALTSLNGISVYPPLYQNYMLISDVSRFILVFGTNDLASTEMDPMLIRWPDQESMIDWMPSPTNQAGSIRLSRGSRLVTAIQSRQEIVVFSDIAVYSMQYVGAPVVWSTQIIGENISIASPSAAAVASSIVYWMGVDKFYKYDGRVQTLRCDLRQHVFGNISQSQLEQVCCGTNEAFNEVWWFYPSANSMVNDKYVIYNYLEDVWYYGAMGRTAWIDAGLRENPIAATYANNLVAHEDGVDDGIAEVLAPLPAYITSAEFDLDDGHNFMFIWRVLPDLTFRGSNAATPSLTMHMLPLKNSGSGYTNPASVGGVASASVNRGVTLPVEEFTGIIYTRLRGRQLSMKIESTDLGVAWQMGAPRIDLRPDGRAG